MMQENVNKQTITNNIKPPNKKLESLKKNFSNCFDKDGNFNFEKFQSELGKNEINFSKESYNMDWLGKSYARLLATDEATTLLKEDEKWNKKPENKNSENLLIKGDNLEVLKHLSNTYYEKIKMIYIDPPYNTGNDGFIYEDDRKFTVEELSQLAGVSEEKAKRILNFTQSKSNSHSAWLTFMYPRLYIAKQLLKEDGVIFISIDDNEVAQLRMMMDEIFGGENFVGDMIRKTRSSANNTDTGFNTQHENCLIFSKKKYLLNLQGNEKTFEQYKNPDNDPNGSWVSSDPTANLDTRQKINNFKIKNPFTNKIDIPQTGSHWRFNEEGFKKLVKSGQIIFKKNHKLNERGFILKRYKKDINNTFYLLDSLNNISNDFLNQVGTKERNEIFDKDIFDYPKPIKLLNTIVQSCTQSNDLILDFFAGSGTTGDAVMQLNAEDGGNRKYILVQLPEKIDSKKNKTAYDFVKNELKAEEPTIFEITKERLICSAKKIKEEQKDKENLFAKNNKQDFGFKIFETTPIWENYHLEATNLDYEQELFDENSLDEDDLKTLLTTWKTYDGVSLTQDLNKINLNGYIGHYGFEKLYLMDKFFKTKHLIALVEKIDFDENFYPNTIIAFGYNFESKALREINEGVKNYANKKNIEVDFLVRY